MRKYDLSTLGDCWTLQLDLAEDCSEGELFALRDGEECALRVTRDGTGVTARFFCSVSPSEDRRGVGGVLEFSLFAPGGGRRLQFVWRDYAIRLYADGALTDEEWPLGRPVREVCAEVGAGVEAFSLTEGAQATEEGETVLTRPMQFFTPEGHNTGVGDCMPFARDGRYCLYYLFDRRGHRSKDGLGAHQWAQISSRDLKTWTAHPLAIGITAQWQGSVCTGSLIQKDGKTYAFYALRASNGTPARLTCSVSEDGIRFAPSGEYFALAAPYEAVSARDPMVFWGADGQYHMLVTTSLCEEGVWRGCLAHMTSPDLHAWTQGAPFLVPGYDDQPECSDYFEWNGRYYLVFSNGGVARYRVSDRPFGPWARPADDLLDGATLSVPKTAAFGARRFVSGFLRRGTYAGCAVTHELFQHADGTLGAKFIEEILPPLPVAQIPARVRLSAPDGRALETLAAGKGGFRARLRLAPRTENLLYGLELRFETEGKSLRYRLAFDPAMGRMQFLDAGEAEFGMARHACGGLRTLTEGVCLDLLVYEGVLDVELDRARVATFRLDGKTAGASWALAAYARWGELEVCGRAQAE